MNYPEHNFARLLYECKRINPPSMTGTYPERIRSVTVEGLFLAPAWAGKRVLILGCGDGTEVSEARKLGWEPTGLTFLDDELHRCDSRARTPEFKNPKEPIPGVVLGDMHALPFEDKSFDCCYSKETLEHSPCPYLALVEMNRVLKDGGEFCHLIPGDWQKQRDPYHFSCFPPWLWCDLFRKAYLEVERVASTTIDCERCTLNNWLYQGHKKRDRLLLIEPVDQYKEFLGFGAGSRTDEGLA